MAMIKLVAMGLSQKLSRNQQHILSTWSQETAMSLEGRGTTVPRDQNVGWWIRKTDIGILGNVKTDQLKEDIDINWKYLEKITLNCENIFYFFKNLILLDNY